MAKQPTSRSCEVATPSKNFRSESVTAMAKELDQSNSVALGNKDAPMAKMLCARNASRSPRGVSGVMTV